MREQTNRFLALLSEIADVIHPVPLLTSLAILFLLAKVGQLHEIYLAYLERPHLLQMAFAGGALALLSIALYDANYLLSKVTNVHEQSDSYDEGQLSFLRSLRDGAGASIAALPWFGVALGLWSESQNAARNFREILNLGRVQGLDTKLAIDLLYSASTGFYLAILILAIGGLVAAFVLHYSGFRSVLSRFTRGVVALIPLLRSTSSGRGSGPVIDARRNERVHYWSLGLVGVLLVGAALLPVFTDDDENMREIVWLFRAIGPLAIILLDVLVLFFFLAVLTILSRKEGVPIVPLVIVIGVSAIFLNITQIAWLVAGLAIVGAVLAAVSERQLLGLLSTIVSIIALLFAWGQKQPADQEAPAKPAQDLASSYDKWLGARDGLIASYRKARPGKRYPVFIIAVEGGGIYAAAAASAFLARLQDLCPSFAQHVFAISGVSGGAVGAAVFRSMLQDQHVSASGCSADSRQATMDLSGKTRRVIEDDHLSPLLGFIVADLLGKFDRSNGLEQSLVQSSRDSGMPFELSRPFHQHWTPEMIAPALVLNATWVETGYRVAFAPFKLRGAGTTLYSFQDDDFRDGLQGPSLARAAIASARFPAILPAFIINRGNKRWNFVDGGYKDSSGALTALDIYTAIKSIHSGEVEPRLILLTSAHPELDFSKIEGTGAKDVLTPVITLLSVRDRLSEDAVTRTMETVGGENWAKRLQDRNSTDLLDSDDWQATLVEVDPTTFSLSLGWRISSSTYEIVSLQMGHPALCTEPNKQIEPGQGRGGVYLSVPTLVANSCVMKSVQKLLALTKGGPD
jgi:hypothetical protein